MASNAKDFLISDIRKKASNEHDYSYDDFAEIEEQIYIPTQKEEWDTVYSALEDIEDEHGFDLTKQKKFVKDIQEPDELEKVDDPEITETASERSKHLITKQIEDSDSQELLRRTNEQIGIKELFDLQEGIYRDTGKKTFIISDQREWDGRVSVELSSTKKKFSLMNVYEAKDDDGLRFQHFGQPVPNKGLTQVEQFNHSFYEYKFVADDQEYLALSTEKLDTVRCKLKGTHVSINDYKTVGESRKLPVNQDIIFVHSVDPAIEVMDDSTLDRYKEDLTHDDIAESLLGGWRQPEWFEKLSIADVFVNDENGFPSHIIRVGPPGTGKSKWVDSALKSVDESQKESFTGSGSTVKGLIPSFKDSPPDEGYLLKTQRVAGVDEKMDLLSNTVNDNNERQKDVFRPLLNLLTHDAKTFESGNGSIKGEMGSVMWAAGNLDAYGITDMKDLGEKIDDAYLSRCIVYQETDSHIAWIDDRKAEIKQKLQDQGLSEDDLFPETDDEFVSLVDTMRSEKHARTDFKKIQEIRKELREFVPGYMKENYRARYEHHMTNIVCGLVKYNYLVGDRESFEAQPEDYEEMKNIFETIISSWGSVNMKEMSEVARTRALTLPQRRVFNVVEDNPGITTMQLAEEHGVENLAESVRVLRSNELVVAVRRDDDQRILYPYWAEEAEEIEDDMKKSVIKK